MVSTSSGPSWSVTSISILVGVGAGYIIGVLTAKWWYWVDRRQSHASIQQQALQQQHLITALTDLTSEVGSLHAVVSEVTHRSERRSRLPGAESIVSEFVSAQANGPDSEDEFFDMEAKEDEEEEAEEEDADFPGSPQNMEYIEELGKSTLESEDSCHTLIKELNCQLEQSPANPPLLWRLARALVHLSMHYEQQGKGEDEKQLLAEATEHAQRGLELDVGVWQSHQWYAIALGSQVKHEGTQKKITVGYEYKEHIDTAISISPDNANLFYLRGRWSYEVAGLSWLEKKAAAALYATPPEATFVEALEDFMRVESLCEAAWKANLLMVAKCHIKLGDTPTAMNWLQKVLQLDVVTTEDKTAHKEVQELMATCEAELDSFS